MDDTLHDLGRLRSISSVTFLVLLLAWESLAPFGSYFVGKTGERLRHGAKNLALGILNALLIGLVFVALWWTTAEWAQAHQFGLLTGCRCQLGRVWPGLSFYSMPGCISGTG